MAIKDYQIVYRAGYWDPNTPDVTKISKSVKNRKPLGECFSACRKTSEIPNASLFFFRNNLTVLDIVTVQGQGARGELMINGKRPSVDSVLLFELKQRHLADCTRKFSAALR